MKNKSQKHNRTCSNLASVASSVLSADKQSSEGANTNKPQAGNREFLCQLKSGNWTQFLSDDIKKGIEYLKHNYIGFKYMKKTFQGRTIKQALQLTAQSAYKRGLKDGRNNNKVR